MAQSNSGLLLGCIADDFTGATDLASMLTRGGMHTVQVAGLPSSATDLQEADAVVIAHKSRTIPADEAVRLSLEGLRILRRAGARQIYFKYCSTFDSTDQGNIGPVIEALLEALGERFTVASPALPENDRTVYNGYLFVGEELLSESGMRHHPLTPMTDANLVRVLGRQMQGRVGRIAYPVVRQGAQAIRQEFTRLKEEDIRCAIVDVLENRDLHVIGAACADLRLVTGGSGLAMGLPENFRKSGLLEKREHAEAPLPRGHAPGAILAGSCSSATRAQVDFICETTPSFRIDVRESIEQDPTPQILDWAADHLGEKPILIYSSLSPVQLKRVQAEFGRERAGALVEEIMAGVAGGLVRMGVRRLVVAGGETAGAVVSVLGVRAMRIGPAIAPGVPWTITGGWDPPLCLALKSGNFGQEDFFVRAFEHFT